MSYKEYGGYLPLELDIKEEYYTDSSLYKLERVNSGRTAILFSLFQLNSKKVYLPLFYCPTVIDSIKKAGFSICFYKTDYLLNPIIERQLDKEDTLILVDYYGVKEKDIKERAKNYCCKIILDFAHNFFAKPVIEDRIFNVYSCRKFFGVSDGAYVISKSFPKKLYLEKEFSYNRTTHLLKSIELSTSKAYNNNLENEEYVGSTFRSMSLLTQQILSTINYTKIKNIRKDNFNTLNSLLSEFQKLKINFEESSAYCYPLLLDKDIRQKLINRKIWIPTMWKELIDDSLQGCIEYEYSRKIHCLPIDQRYSSGDMEYLAELIIKLYKE